MTTPAMAQNAVPAPPSDNLQSTLNQLLPPDTATNNGPTNAANPLTDAISAPETQTTNQTPNTQSAPPALPIATPNTAPQAPATNTNPSSAPVLPDASSANNEVPNFFQPDPGMSLNAGEAANPGPPPGPTVQKSDEEIQSENRKQAFDSALQGLLPLKPDEIRQLLEHFDRTQESVETPIYPNPKPEVAVQTVSLDPGVPPVVVKVAYGNVTTLNILDVSGAPWPIEDISWAGNFEVVESSSGNGSHIVRITPQSEFANGNMSIRLLTLKTPVILSLETSRDIVHYRFDAIIPQYGPMAQTPLIDQGVTIAAGDEGMSSVLQGVAPGGAVKMAVVGTDGRTTAYKMGGQTYVRTPLTLLSPSWTSSVASADGMHVYAIRNAPVLLLSDKGQMVRARLSDRENFTEDAAHE
jgi:intracellular multiplication protein IcmK